MYMSIFYKNDRGAAVFANFWDDMVLNVHKKWTLVNETKLPKPFWY